MHCLTQNFNINNLYNKLCFQHSLHFMHFSHIVLAQIILQIQAVDADASVGVLIGLIWFKSCCSLRREKSEKHKCILSSEVFCDFA